MPDGHVEGSCRLAREPNTHSGTLVVHHELDSEGKAARLGKSGHHLANGFQVSNLSLTGPEGGRY